MADPDEKTPITLELQDPVQDDCEITGEGVIVRSGYGDDNDSDCVSTTTSCSALGASHPNIHSQAALTIGPAEGSSWDPSLSLPADTLQPVPTTSNRLFYDNPCASIECGTTDKQVVKYSESKLSDLRNAVLLNNEQASVAAVSSLRDSDVTTTAAAAAAAGTGDSASGVSSSASVPVSLKNSASPSIIGSSVTSSPIHATCSSAGPEASSSITAIAPSVSSSIPPTSRGASTAASSATTPLSVSGTYNNNISNNNNNNSTTMGHSRCSSWVSGGVTSGAPTVCHSRGASTEGSTIDVFTSSAADSRRGTYSEAGTLPIGSLPEGSLGGTIIEEEHPLDKLSEKKLSSDLSSNNRNGSASTLTRGKSAISRHLCCIGATLNSCDWCRPIMQEYNPLPSNPTKLDRLKYAFTCPPHGKVGVFLTYLVLLLLTWGSLYSITGAPAAPGGNLFSLLIVFVCSVLGGEVSQACRLPPLLGMLIVGIALRSVPGIRMIGDNLDPEWSASIRNIALVVILLRAGLGLDPRALKKLSFVVFRLAFTPCLVEATVVAIVTHFLLDFPWKWGFMLGFVLAAVSPAVVVPCLLQLSQQGYGVDKGIPTLVIAAASLDDVLAISLFGLLLGINFSQGSMAMQAMQGPIEVVLGLSYGVVLGVLCWLLPSKRHAYCSLLQFAVLFTAGLFALFGSQRIEFGGAGALAVLIMAFIAGVGFRRQSEGDYKNLVGQHCNFAWTFLQPLLFALIGTEIQILSLELDTVGWGLATLCISLTCRVVTTFFVVLGSGLDLRERFFVALAWLPKATVQAAIGSTALDYARRIGADEDQITLAKQVLTIAVLVILVTAPIGAVAIMTSAPRLLQKQRPSNATPETV